MVSNADLVHVGTKYFQGVVGGWQPCSTWQRRKCALVGSRGVITKGGQNRDKAALAEVHQYKVITGSYEEEFRSSRSVALGLHRRYRDVVNGGFSKNLKEFVNAGVTAYAVGCTDEGLRKELMNVGETEGVSGESFGESRRVGLKSKLSTEEVEECILWLSLVFLAILCSPPPAVVRWSAVSPVCADAQLQWRGFCALIANAYYMRGMAWIPVKRLQMEQLAVVGYAEEPSLVSDRMRIVFCTLETVCPQWPKQ